MAAVSLSPPPIDLSTMSTTRRIPLSSNQNVANSPIRASTLAKPKRAFVNVQREEAYAQPPPAKKQALDSGIPRPLKSPQSQRVARTQLSLQSRRNASTYESKLAKERSGHHHAETGSNAKYTEKDLDEIRRWQSHHKTKFPKMVFYFDNIQEDTRAKIVKQITSLGAVSIAVARSPVFCRTLTEYYLPYSAKKGSSLAKSPMLSLAAPSRPSCELPDDKRRPSPLSRLKMSSNSLRLLIHRSWIELLNSPYGESCFRMPNRSRRPQRVVG
jgi:hypothetical protein